MTVKSAIIAQLTAEAAAGTSEICGALIGDGQVIRRAQMLPNHSDDPNCFFIPAALVRSAEAAAEAEGLQVVGFYHSHPRGSANPSRADLDQAVPGYLYLIVGRRGEVRAWRLQDDRSAFTELALSP